MKLILETRNAYQSGTSRWIVKNHQGETVATVLRGNNPFAKYRLNRFGHPVEEFTNKAKLENAISILN